MRRKKYYLSTKIGSSALNLNSKKKNISFYLLHTLYIKTATWEELFHTISSIESTPLLTGYVSLCQNKILTVSLVWSSRIPAFHQEMLAGGLAPDDWHATSYSLAALSGWFSPSRRTSRGRTATDSCSEHQWCGHLIQELIRNTSIRPWRNHRCVLYQLCKFRHYHHKYCEEVFGIVD
jgi:hypothetical protein